MKLEVLKLPYISSAAARGALVAGALVVGTSIVGAPSRLSIKANPKVFRFSLLMKSKGCGF